MCGDLQAVDSGSNVVVPIGGGWFWEGAHGSSAAEAALVAEDKASAAEEDSAESLTTLYDSNGKGSTKMA